MPVRRITRILDGTGSTDCEIAATLPALVWAIVLLLPLHTFGISPAFKSMRWLPEWAWGLVFLTGFIAAVIAWWREWRLVRKVCMLAAVYGWVAIGAMLVYNLPEGLGWTCVTPAFLAGLAFTRLSTEREPAP